MYNYMKKFAKLFAVLALVSGAAACASVEKMAQMAENVKIQCTPEVLEAVAGSVDVTVSVSYPKDYFNPQAILEVTPVIVYEGGEAAAEKLCYQGEKVKDNHKVVSSDGQTVTETIHFDYVEGMEKSHLELRGVAKAKNKSVNLPVVKVADGCNTTYMLVKANGVAPVKADAYQDVTTGTAEGQILYLVNSSEVRSSELKGQSMKDFKAALDKINADERAKVTGTEIIAYASPEGAEDLNNKLSGNRSSSASKAWDSVTKGSGVAAPEVKSVGEDWEGFQKLVSESNLEDKDLILRVLSMYSDPAVRENEIKNMSEVYTSLKGEVLPELRRARLIAKVEYQNLTNEELQKVLNENGDQLDEDSYLRLASLAKKPADKEDIYQRGISKLGEENAPRCVYNLAATLLNEGKTAEAEKWIKKLDKADAESLKGIVALQKGDVEAAKSAFALAKTNEEKANLGIALILNGEYEDAARVLADAKGCCHNLALAYILTNQLDAASKAIHCECAKCLYLKAIIAAREGNATAVKDNLSKAFEKDASLKERAAKDIEFAGYEI